MATADVRRGTGTTSIHTASVTPTHISPDIHKCAAKWISKPTFFRSRRYNSVRGILGKANRELISCYIVCSKHKINCQQHGKVVVIFKIQA